jgi:hypothetical protein
MNKTPHVSMYSTLSTVQDPYHNILPSREGVGSKTADICHGILQQAPLPMSQKSALSLICQRKYGDIARLPPVLLEEMAVNPPLGQQSSSA